MGAGELVVGANDDGILKDLCLSQWLWNSSCTRDYGLPTTREFPDTKTKSVSWSESGILGFPDLPSRPKMDEKSASSAPVVQFRAMKRGNRPQGMRKRDDDEEDAPAVLCQPAGQQPAPSTAMPGKRDETASKGTTVYQSTREVMPARYAGDEATATLETDTTKRSTSTSTYGPQKAPSFLRSTVRFDYQPDICKDYKETGFCGFGDSCKFLHDRGDYKSGWQLEKEWEDKQAAKRRKIQELEASLDPDGEPGAAAAAAAAGDEEEDYTIADDEPEFPFACFLCRQAFVNPVVTACGHYFCEQCAITKSRSSTHCAVCSKQTHGIFNKARRLIKFMDKTKGAAAAAVKDAQEQGEEEEGSGGGGKDTDKEVRKAPVGAWESI